MRSPLIFVPRKESIAEFHMPPMRLAGYVGWRLIRDGRVIRESPLQKNLLTNAGFDYLGNGDTYGGGMFAASGTGSNAPAAGDTGLQAEVTAGGRRFQGSTSSGYVPIAGMVTQDYQWRRIVFTFTETQANGNLTEFGTFSSGGTLLARQLYKDVGGTPTTIVKTNIDQLEITYEYRSFPPISDATLTAFAISGDSITSDITIRPANTSSVWLSPIVDSPLQGGARAYESSTLTARTTAPSGTNEANSGGSFAAYTNGHYYIDETITWEPANAVFTTGIGLIQLYKYSSNYLYQASFATQIPKTNVKRLTVVIRRSWARFP